MPKNIIAPQVFNDIGRGTSLTMPVLIKKLDGTPFDLTGWQVYFTMKEVQFDYDYDDARAVVAKEVSIDTPEEGKFFIQLTSKDTYHAPGQYHFDIELVRDGGVARICLFKFDLIGGATNRTVNPLETSVLFSDAINVTLTPTVPIVITAPLVSDPPENIIETIVAEPAYLLEELDTPIRNVKIKSYAPQVSFAMRFTADKDGLDKFFRFENYSFPNLSEDCPLKNGGIRINNLRVTFELQEEMHADIWESHFEVSMGQGPGGKHIHQMASEPFHVHDNVAHGTINAILYSSDRRQIHITGNYTMPREQGSRATWMFRIDYFNWE